MTPAVRSSKSPGRKTSIGIVFIVAIIVVLIVVVAVTIPNHPPTMPGNHRYSMSLHPLQLWLQRAIIPYEAEQHLGTLQRLLRLRIFVRVRRGRHDLRFYHLARHGR